MTERAAVTIYIAIDCDGDYAVGVDEETARERYAEDIGDANERAVVVREVILNVPLPRSVIEHTGANIDLPAEPEPEAVTA